MHRVVYVCMVVTLALLSWPAFAQPQQQPEPYSPSYAGRVRAIIQPHIVYGESTLPERPAEVRVRLLPDGTVQVVEVVQSSGVAAWDQAVRMAVLKAGKIPRDVNGQVPGVLVISFSPK